MLKMLGTVLVIGACTALGLSARQQLARRVRNLTQLVQAFDLLLAEIGTNSTPLPQLMEQMSHEDLGEIRCFFAVLCRRMAQNRDLSFPYHWQSTARDLAEDLGLAPPETDLLRQTASYLGRYQTAQQIAGLTHTRTQLQGVLGKAQAALDGKGTLYRTCGVAVGIVVVLLML